MPRPPAIMEASNPEPISSPDCFSDFFRLLGEKRACASYHIALIWLQKREGAIEAHSDSQKPCSNPPNHLAHSLVPAEKKKTWCQISLGTFIKPSCLMWLWRITSHKSSNGSWHFSLRLVSLVLCLVRLESTSYSLLGVLFFPLLSHFLSK